MPDHIARRGDPAIVDGRPLHNAWCVWCDAVTTGYWLDLVGQGWQPSSGVAWSCPDHQTTPIKQWYDPPMDIGPNTLRAMFEPIPDVCDDEMERAA